MGSTDMNDGVALLETTTNQSLDNALSTPCILHKGYLNHNGYGQQWFEGKDHRAHRLAYEREYGHIPQGKIVRHKCDVRSCINPEHLELGTHADNTKDMMKRGRIKRGEQLPQSKLKEPDIHFIRMMKSIFTQNRLGEIFNVRRETISEIHRGLRWKHI